MSKTPSATVAPVAAGGGWNQQAQWQRADGDVAVISRVDNDWTTERGMPDAASAKFQLKKPAK